VNDRELLLELLEAESEREVLAALKKRGLLDDAFARWEYLGRMPNNQSVVHNQQSSPTAALVEKYVNGVDAILMRHCKSQRIDPRGETAYERFPTMQHIVEARFPEIPTMSAEDIRKLAANQLVLYATGSKERPCLSLYDDGEGQLAENFPSTFCSLIHADASGSYKGAVPFVQGKFNMGGTGVLPFCSEQRKLQLIVSRVPADLAGTDDHQWAFTLMCFFPGRQDPAWKYLVGPDRTIMTAGPQPLALIPDSRVPKANELVLPRERAVASGTLIKMYDFTAPKSNICGTLYKHLKQFLLRPPLPLRIHECRESYRAKVMAATMWDMFARWQEDKILEPGFEEGADIEIPLSSGDVIPGQIRVFRTKKEKRGKDESVDDVAERYLEPPVIGVHALINGQSHANRDEQFFKGRAVDKEHIAGTLLVTLDFTGLRQDSKNALLMSNRERFREGDPLLKELLDVLKDELRTHDALIALNNRRYEEKVKDSVEDEDGLKALEELLSSDPMLAGLFGSSNAGRLAAKVSDEGQGGTIEGEPAPFEGLDFPTYFKRADGSTQIAIELPQGAKARASFLTDVKNSYFTRRRPTRGKVTFAGTMTQPAMRLFNGRLTFTCGAKDAEVGATLSTVTTIYDRDKDKPFTLTINATVIPARVPMPKPEPDPDQNDDEGDEDDEEPVTKVQAGPSRPAVLERDDGPDKPPISIERDPRTTRLVIYINTDSPLRAAARNMRPASEQAAVDFIYKYGLALATMGLLDHERHTPHWKENEPDCRERIALQMNGLARVIVPLCMSLPKNIPRK
jgi:hypothetical protein